MKRLFFIAAFFSSIICFGQNPGTKPKANPFAGSAEKKDAPTADANATNLFPTKGFAGIGTLTPGAPLEIKRGIGNSRGKNFLIKLSNEWANGGQNEPSIMFSNGDNTNPKNISYWSIGARVSGDNVIKSPQTFKICYKSPTDAYEKEFFSVDSYEGRVKIGNVPTQFDGYKLYVEQGILTEKVKVAVKGSADWFDHVFEKSYPLMPLLELEKYISKNKHLPDVPSANEVVTNGLDLGKMNGILLKKVEELTLHLIEMKKELEKTKKEVQHLRNKK